MPKRIKYAQPPTVQTRAKTHARGYGADWRKVRRIAMEQTNWLCVDCLQAGRTTPAIDGHHVEKIKDAPHLRLDVANVMPLCKACHDARDGRWGEAATG